jgi:putative tryptophan/tyrosine transport system substrate-binding protein
MHFHRWKRREVLTLLGGAAAAWPVVARAQQRGAMRRIGVLVIPAKDDVRTTAQLAEFRQGLERLGWVEGRNIRIDYRFAGGRADQFQPLAKELVALQPEAIIAFSTPTATALQRETRTIPIVFANVSDPIGSGFIAGLARPGGNLTGVLLYEEGITGKWLAMLKEIAPRLERASAIGNPKTMPYEYFFRSAEAAAASLAIEVVRRPTDGAAEIERAIETAARVQNGCLLILPDSANLAHRDLLIALAAQHRLPAVYFVRTFVADGGLMSYGTSFYDGFRLSASYVDRILHGTAPADLPVQAPTKYETVVNLKTAKALGLDVPPSLLVRADEVIE